ncbi:protein MIS12 homolog isoform X1 [Anolis carolinensis]|uniref:protein MIS12 homolog isoform X1 n=1 Tax=Anolis carolinensis TaxID=28377 RepID=UPI002F2B7C0D
MGARGGRGIEEEEEEAWPSLALKNRREKWGFPFHPGQVNLIRFSLIPHYPRCWLIQASADLFSLVLSHRMSDPRTLYSTQFFGFTPQTFLLRVYRAFQDSLSRSMVSMEADLLERFPDEDPALIRQGTEGFLACAKDHLEAVFPQMEATLCQGVLDIPDNVLLLEDQAQEEAGENFSKEGLQELQEEIRQLEAQLQAENRAAEALEAELEEQRIVRAHLEGLRQWLQSLEEATRGDGSSGSLQEGLQALTGAALQLQDVVRTIKKQLAAPEPQ